MISCIENNLTLVVNVFFSRTKLVAFPSFIVSHCCIEFARGNANEESFHYTTFINFGLHTAGWRPCFVWLFFHSCYLNTSRCVYVCVLSMHASARELIQVTHGHFGNTEQCEQHVWLWLILFLQCSVLHSVLQLCYAFLRESGIRCELEHLANLIVIHLIGFLQCNNTPLLFTLCRFKSSCGGV